MKNGFIWLLAGLVALVLAVFAVVVYRSCAPPGEFDAARLLPADTVAYARLAHLTKLWQALDESDARETLVDLLADAGVDRKAIAAWEATARQVRALHLSFHDARLYRDRLDLDLAAIAELEKPTPLDALLPADFMARLAPAGEHGGVSLYELDVPVRMSGTPPARAGSSPPAAVGRRWRGRAEHTVLFAAAGDKVFASTDRVVMEGMLDALTTPRADSLAAQDAYRTVRDGQPARDVELYVAVPGLLAALGDVAPAGGGGDLRALAELLGLTDAASVRFATDFDRAGGCLRLRLDPASRAYRLLAQPAAGKAVTDYLPEDTVWSAAASIGDGKRTWRDLDRLAADFLEAMDGPRGGRAYCAHMDGLREGAVWRFAADLAPLVKEIGLFANAPGEAGRVCLFAKVTDADAARKLLDRASGRLSGARPTSLKHRGVTIRAHEGGLAWALSGDDVLISPSVDLVKAAIDAKEGGRTLEGTEPGALVARALPGDSVAVAYVNLERLLRDARLYRHLPGPAREFVDDLSCGAALTAADGLVELRWTSSKQADLPQTCRVLVSALEALREESEKLHTQHRLEQMWMAAIMWASAHRGSFPSSLATLSIYLDDPVIFLHPRRRRPPPKGPFVCDYASAFERGLAGSRRTPGPRLPALWEKRAWFKGVRAVGFFDGHVEFVTEKEFHRLLGELDRFIGGEPKQ